MVKYLACMVLVVSAMSSGFSQEYVENFETGVGGAFSYHKPPDDLKIERLQGGAASGQWYLRAALPGQKKLEGLALTATGLTGARLVTVTAQVRGQGEVWLCLISGNGWLYAPRTQTLTGQWQEVSLSKVLLATDKSLGIYFLTRDVQPGAVFEVDHVRVTTVPPAPTRDAAVGPWRLEAEDFAPSSKSIASDAQALGGKMLQADQYLIATDLPVPQTSRPLSLACRVRSGAADDAWRLVTWQGGNTQYLQTLKPTQTGEWEWLRFAPAFAGELGDRFGVCVTRTAGAKGVVALDSLVISTQADLTPEQLSAAPELLGRRPFASIGRGPAGSGVTLTGFVGIGSTVAAQAQTFVRVTYDDGYLLLHFDCPEPLLDTAQQRRHEFLAKVTQRDGEVYQDDSVIILLQPPGSRRVYDFTVNALGTIADAVDSEPDLWESRDVSWNSQATARGQIEEKRWLADVTIPWADLGGRPQVGDTWGACFGRLAKGRKEQSSWNLSARGFHDPVALGTLMFMDTVPDVRLDPPATLKLQGNTIPPVTTHAVTPSPLVVTEIRSSSGARHIYAPTFDVPAEPDLRVAYGVLDGASLQPLVLTPLLPQGVKSSSMELVLSTPGPWELLLNGQIVASGAQSPAKPLSVPLEKGMNVLALRLTKGTAALQGTMGDFTLDAAHWRMAPAEVTDPIKAADDGAWPVAPQVGQDPTLGPIVGDKDKPVVLRRTLLFEHTRVWPTPEPVYCLAQGVTQHMVFRTEGLKGRKLDGWETFIAVPPGFEVVGSTGFYGKNPGIPHWTTTQLGEQTIAGQRMRVAKIAADLPLLTGRHYIMSEFEAFVRTNGVPPPTPSLQGGGQTAFVYWSQANDGSVIEAPQTIKVRVLPPIQGAQCKTLVWQLWGGWLSNMDDLAMREQILACARAAGFNDVVSGDRWTSDNAPRFGLQHTLGVSFASWSLNLAPYLKEHPDQRLIKPDGKPSDQYLCMTLLLGEGWGAVRDALREKLDAIKPHTVDYDYEYPPFTSHHSCYCDRCLQAFREFAKLPANETLTPETIRAQHHDQWVDFMARRVAKMFGLFSRTIHELSPGTLFSTYSGYATPDNADRYGVDWRYVGEEQGCDRAGCGYGRPVEAIRATIEALRGIPLICGALLTPYERDILTPVNPLTRAWLLRTVLDSTGGVLVYDRTEMDGRSWWAMGETTRLVAAHEAAFLQGKRLPMEGFSDGQVQPLQHGGTTLLCLMNQTNKPLTLKVPLPGDWGSGQEFYSGRKVTAGAMVEVTLEPGETEVVVLTR